MENINKFDYIRILKAFVLKIHNKQSHRVGEDLQRI